eukprot:scaffold8374_cov175-Amphora_coffeaeformis.AAC.119
MIQVSRCQSALLMRDAPPGLLTFSTIHHDTPWPKKKKKRRWSHQNEKKEKCATQAARTDGGDGGFNFEF